jgi:methyltransferase (TIGR00027 family)
MPAREHKHPRVAADTAEAMAALRAAGAAERDETVRNPDYLARAFVSTAPRVSALVKVPTTRRLLPAIAERLAPGGYYFETARVKCMDAILRDELAREITQLLILGAGYDTRAYRFADQLAQLRVFEIDQRAMTRLKRAKVARILGELPAHVHYLQSDLASDDLSAVLRDSPYDRTQPTLVMLSGVSAYLPPAAMTRLFRFIADHTSPRTTIVFDYVYAEMVDGSDEYHGAAQLRKRLSALGERLRFGIPTGQLEALLAAHGLTLTRHHDPHDLAARYLRRADGTHYGTPYGFAAIAHARIARDQRSPTRSAGTGTMAAVSDRT